MPHVSYIPRKPEDLGCELKTVCDGTSGLMMFMEIQEGQTRMRQKTWHQEYDATAPCALRCAQEPGFAQSHRRPEERSQRAFLGDSWFAGLKTATAMEKELGCKFLGPVKTSTSGFPQESIRHTLHGSERGTTVVFEEHDDDGDPTGRHAIGWNDHWYKGFITNYGSAKPGKRANKKRQRSDGRNYTIGVDRCKQLEHYYEVAGYVDRHNRYRQHMLKFHKVRKTKTWATRMILEILGASLVDTYLACRHLMPMWRDMDTSESNFMAFVMDLIPQVDARSEEDLDVEELDPSSDPIMSPTPEFTACAHKSIGRNGKRKDGTAYTNQQRCKYCVLAGRKESNSGRAIRTSWCCRAHPGTFICKSSERPCMAEHLVDIANADET
jgi:hypothetical protein